VLFVTIFTVSAKAIQVISLRRANLRERKRYAKARPAREILPKLLGKNKATALLTPKRGRPPLETTKEHINIRIDADVLAAFRASSNGWQTRVNTVIREWLETHV
jgi:uncharacterized protein (DUF4415 family)